MSKSELTTTTTVYFSSMLEDATMLAVRKSAKEHLERLLNGRSPHHVELVYASQPNWPFGSLKAVELNSKRPLRCSVLDSSFNPPTRSHLALTNARLPQQPLNDQQEDNDYDAKLLLLSVKNADKKLKPGDATFLQRLEMMALLTKHINPSTTQAAIHGRAAPSTANVAIAITDEPTFVGKSEALLAFLKQRFSSPSTTAFAENIELTFLVGQDTLERLFSSRYYSSDAVMMNALHKFLSPAPEGDNSRLASANRVMSSGISSNEVDQAKVSSLTQHYLSLGRLAIIDIGKEESTYSSSAVRTAIALEGYAPKDLETRQTWRNFVTTEVADYIIQQRLYMDDP